MLPKIVTGWQNDVADFLLNFGLNKANVLSIDCENLSISDFREWLNFCNNLTRSDDRYVMLLTNLDLLSVEAQNILLKPLEEKRDSVGMYLLAKNENMVLPTILSRCEVVTTKKAMMTAKYWLELVKLWKSNPGNIVDFCETFPLNEINLFLAEALNRLKIEIAKEVTIKRIKIIDCFVKTVQEISLGNVNKRLALENLLFTTWRLIKTNQQGLA